MATNNFKELEKKQISTRGDGKIKSKEAINDSHGLFMLFGNLVELYIPQVGNILTALGSTSNKPSTDDKNSKS